jgi:hypothetical protein
MAVLADDRARNGAVEVGLPGQNKGNTTNERHNKLSVAQLLLGQPFLIRGKGGNFSL